MLELKVKLLSKRTIQLTTQTEQFIPFDICDSFFAEYYKTTQQVYWRLNEAPKFFTGDENLYLLD